MLTDTSYSGAPRGPYPYVTDLARLAVLKENTTVITAYQLAALSLAISFGKYYEETCCGDFKAKQTHIEALGIGSMKDLLQVGKTVILNQRAEQIKMFLDPECEAWAKQNQQLLKTDSLPPVAGAVRWGLTALSVQDMKDAIGGLSYKVAFDYFKDSPVTMLQTTIRFLTVESKASQSSGVESCKSYLNYLYGAGAESKQTLFQTRYDRLCKYFNDETEAKPAT